MCISAKECQQTLSHLQAFLKPCPIPCAPLTPRHHTRPDTDPWVEIHEELASEKNVLDDFLFYYFEIGNSFHVTIQKKIQHPTSSVSFPNVPNTKSRWYGLWSAITGDTGAPSTAWFLSSRPPKSANCPRKGITCSSTNGHSARFWIWALMPLLNLRYTTPTGSSQRIPNDLETW